MPVLRKRKAVIRRRLEQQDRDRAKKIDKTTMLEEKTEFNFNKKIYMKSHKVLLRKTGLNKLMTI